MGKVCAFFGHRVIGADISSQLEQAVRTAITNGATTFWVGGYGAFDSYAAICVRRLKKEYPQISLDLILAYLPTGKNSLADAYDSTIYPEGLELVPQRFAISKRNRWIVDNCDMIIAYVRSNMEVLMQPYNQQTKKDDTLSISLSKKDLLPVKRQQVFLYGCITSFNEN